MTKGMNIMVGYDNLIMGDRSLISGGKDGIMPSDSRLKGNTAEDPASGIEASGTP